MTDAALECLKQDDLRLFYKGACHVFAVALQRYRSEQRYELCRVVCRGLGAYHVYARTGEWLLDVGGLKRERDYFDWLNRRALDHGWAPPITAEITSDEELLRRARVDQQRGLVNEWGLFTDPDFVSQAMTRARTLVEESDRYRADLMR